MAYTFATMPYDLKISTLEIDGGVDIGDVSNVQITITYSGGK